MQSSLSECDEGSVFPSPVIETSLSRVFGQFCCGFQFKDRKNENTILKEHASSMKWLVLTMGLLTLLINYPLSISTQVQ